MCPFMCYTGFSGMAFLGQAFYIGDGDMKYQRIRDLREDADLYQKQLAELLHCSQQTYSDYECGKLDIPTDVLIKLADFYETTTDYILGRSNRRTNHEK